MKLLELIKKCGLKARQTERIGKANFSGGGLWRDELWRAADFDGTDFGGRRSENPNPTRQFLTDAHTVLTGHNPFCHPYLYKSIQNSKHDSL